MPCFSFCLRPVGFHCSHEARPGPARFSEGSLMLVSVMRQMIAGFCSCSISSHLWLCDMSMLSHSTRWRPISTSGKLLCHTPEGSIYACGITMKTVLCTLNTAFINICKMLVKPGLIIMLSNNYCMTKQLVDLWTHLLLIPPKVTMKVTYKNVFHGLEDLRNHICSVIYPVSMATQYSVVGYSVIPLILPCYPEQKSHTLINRTIDLPWADSGKRGQWGAHFVRHKINCS